MKYAFILRNILAVVLIGTGNSVFAQLTPMTLGTIKPGDSIVIYYDVTINSGTGSQVSNQGTITGSNFSSLVTDDPATVAADDPTITLVNMAAMPVRLMDIRAAYVGSTVQVRWNVSSEDNMERYDVERSLDGRVYSKVGSVLALNATAPSAYAFTDAAPGLALNFYRLRMIEKTGATKYSAIVRISREAHGGNVMIYPNPVIGGNITVSLSNLQRGNYELLLYNSIGQVAHRQSIYHDGGSTNKNIFLPSSLKGLYQVQVKAEKLVYTYSLIVE